MMLAAWVPDVQCAAANDIFPVGRAWKERIGWMVYLNSGYSVLESIGIKGNAFLAFSVDGEIARPTARSYPASPDTGHHK
jgi:hypothetical protein